eukprot:CAMPEP_0171000244 /NCGR_PEP_ID=MMETSP0736-20130129/14637_1 /TAXON_ID=186038 /ORGANISM="Fragilariopsis kerguelensis, Strain L26-C5" /LENGTH=295 /DNA_ID=CAMNT_0011427683 /DNA_START=166 /DNA_END=1050 /DNA_ORIENTATION=-
MSLTGMTINSLGINKRDIDQISRIISDESLDNKNSKRRKLSVNITASQNHQFHHVRVPQGRIKRPLSPRSCPPVIKPCNYLMKLFQNKDLPNTTTTRIDSFSIEQALYFEPYQESAEIPTDILKALRTSNVGQLRSFLKEKKNSLKDCRNQFGSFSIEQALYFEPYQESKIPTDILTALRTSNVGQLRVFLTDNNKNSLKECRNQFGENLLHLACRMGGISGEVIAFLIQEAKVPLNVRDRFGRTPLHHACMSSHPNFDTIELVIRHVPRVVLLFEDDTGNIPFDLIPSRCYAGW